MVNPSGLIAERLGGADYDGDMIKIIIIAEISALLCYTNIQYLNIGINCNTLPPIMKR